MSRSYRAPWFVDSYGSKYKKLTKRAANRAVRRTAEVADGCAYRKVFNPYDIVDSKWQWDPDGWIFWHNGEPEWVLPDPEWKARRK